MPTPPGFASVAVQIVHAGLSRPAYLTFGVDPSATDPQSVAASISGTMAAAGSLASVLDSETVISEVRVSLGTDGGEDLVGGITTSITGGTGHSSLPPNCAFLVHKRTARGGRRGRGRLFIPWCSSETNVDEAGIIQTAYLNTFQTAMNTWLSGLAAGSCPMVLLHDPGITSPGPPNVVTALTVDKLISTQRRRLGR